MADLLDASFPLSLLFILFLVSLHIDHPLFIPLLSKFHHLQPFLLQLLSGELPTMTKGWHVRLKVLKTGLRLKMNPISQSGRYFVAMLAGTHPSGFLKIYLESPPERIICGLTWTDGSSVSGTAPSVDSALCGRPFCPSAGRSGFPHRSSWESGTGFFPCGPGEQKEPRTGDVYCRETERRGHSFILPLCHL